MGRYLKYHHALKPCGHRHAYCKVCRPELCKPRPRRKYLTHDEQTKRYAVGYKPHRTKTMWQRHTEAHGIVDEPHYYSVEQQRNTPRQKPPKHIPTGRKFSNPELRRFFGFTTGDIYRFRHLEKVVANQQRRRAAGIKERSTRNEARDKRIVELRLDKEMTLEQIGGEIGVTRERVRQILSRIEREAQVVFPHNGRGKKGSTYSTEVKINVAAHCKVCGVVIEIKESKYDATKPYFCKPHRMSKQGYRFYLLGAKWWEMNDTERARFRYHNTPGKREQSRLAAARWKASIKHDPVKWAHFQRLQREATDRWLAKQKAKAEVNKPKPRKFIET